MDLIGILGSYMSSMWEHTKPVEFAQSLATAAVIWHMVKKSMAEELKKMREDLTRFITAMEAGFKSGEERMGRIENHQEKIDDRLLVLETKSK